VKLHHRTVDRCCFSSSQSTSRRICACHRSSTCDDVSVTASVPIPLSRPAASGNPTRPSRDAVWRDVRALRHQPPGLAARGDRRRVFGAALEQAEQLFTTAASAGHASRPISLFYGLSQAGRAIAAASTLAIGADWKLRGHGIEAANLDQRPDLPLLTVGDQGTGSFTQLAPLLKSGTLPEQTPLGKLWRVIPDLLTAPLDDNSISSPVLSASAFTRTEEGVVVRLIGLPQAYDSKSQVVQFLEAYPTLNGHESHPDFAPPTDIDHRTGRICTFRFWRFATPEENDLGRLMNKLTQPYGDDNERWIFPALGGHQIAIHPLLAWWAILYALSMLARYEPASWTRHIDVDLCANAVPLETALDQALDTCPRLILHAIQTVSTGE
jgi:YaaC-like protein